MDLVAHGSGDADAAGRRERFESRGDVHAVAEDVVVAVDDDVAQIDADAKVDAQIRGGPLVALGERALHADRAAQRGVGARELDEHAVAGRLDEAPAQVGNGRVDHLGANRAQVRERPGVVALGVPAESHDVRDQDRREPAIRRRRQPSAPRAATGHTHSTRSPRMPTIQS